MGTNLGKFTMLRHLVKVQAELNRKLFFTSKYFFEFNLAGLERGDLQGRNEAYKAALGGSSGPGYLTPNEVRAMENRPPIEGGDKLVDWERKGNAKSPDEAAA
jgi:phage portal protein BeeE